MHYWGYRVDSSHSDYFFKEIQDDRLRQGWGYSPEHELSYDKELYSGARRNMPIFSKVKRGDILLIPHVEGWDDITIVRATEDFDKGYKFDIPKEYGDYGHIFPVKFIKQFSRHHDMVSAAIRETMKCRSRFWNIDSYSDDIENIINNKIDLTSKSTYEQRFQKRAFEAFDIDKFAEDVYKELNQYTQASEWEHILCEGFRKIFPMTYIIETTSNTIEAGHGADILIKIPGILDTNYIIAIQVKDYEGTVSEAPIDQILKSDTYSFDYGKLIDKYVIMTKASKEENIALIKRAEKEGINLIFKDDLKTLLAQMAKAFIGQTAVF